MREAVFAKSCICDRNRRQPQPFATVCVIAVRLSTVESASGVVLKRFRVKLTRGAAIILVFAEDLSVRVICGAAFILAFAEEVSVRVICVAAVIWAFAEGVSV